MILNREYKTKYKFADLHCHPNLKTFGYSFLKKPNNKSHIWNYKPPTFFSKLLNVVIGITKFTQADFTSMSKGNVKIAFVSLYPFEKGFFINNYFGKKTTARLANFVTSIGYDRIRYIQENNNYYEDLTNEYIFLKNSCKEVKKNENIFKWNFCSSLEALEKSLNNKNAIAVILTIEGAHVFNSGLNKFGYKTKETEVLKNVINIKHWEHPPFFITLAHNFNNDLCGHARSLNQLGPLVNQFENINEGISNLGLKVIKALLENKNGKRILIDVKHMSVKSRFQYYKIIEQDYKFDIPIIVSHGAVTGTNLKGNHLSFVDSSYLCPDDINFFDEELVFIAKTKGLFALQMDGNRLTNKSKLKKNILNFNSKLAHKKSAQIVWNQIQHIAEVLDSHHLYSWGTACLGSDFDGTINPLAGIWTSECFQNLANELLELASAYLKNKNPLQVPANKNILSKDIIESFVFNNALMFLKKNLV